MTKEAAAAPVALATMVAVASPLMGPLICAKGDGGRTRAAKKLSGAMRKEPRGAKRRRHTMQGQSRVEVSAQRRSSALAHLQETIAGHPREERRKVLETLPGPVRFALLEFMEAQRLQPKATTALTPFRAIQPRGGNAQRLEDPGNFCREGRGLISKKKGGFNVVINLVPCLVVCTRCVPTRAAAEHFRAGLQCAKHLVQAHSTRCTFRGKDQVIEVSFQCIQQALEAACVETHLTVEELGLSFCPVVGAQALIGRTLRGSCTTSLKEALAQRHALMQGRELGWPALRRAWVAAMKESVPTRRSRVFGRGQWKPKAEELAESIADRAFDAHAERMEEQKARRARRALPLAIRFCEYLLSRKTVGKGTGPLRLKKEMATCESKKRGLTLEQPLLPQCKVDRSSKRLRP